MAAYVLGADVVAASFLAAADDVNDRIESAGRRVAANIADRQRELVPVDEGTTRDSISWDALDDQIGFEIGPTHFVARFLEFGTWKMAPRPFVWPSAAFYADEWVRVVKQAGGDA